MTEYRIEIQASNADGSIWQTMHTERAARKVAVEGVADADAYALRTSEVPAVAGYIWEPFDASEGLGIGGLPRIMYRAHRLVSAQDLAEDTATGQNVAEGDDWRVRVYIDDDSTHVAEAGPGATIASTSELAARIAGLAALPPLERADEAKRLIDETRVALASLRRAAVYETTRLMPWDDVAKALGVSTAAINQLVTAQRASRG